MLKTSRFRACSARSAREFKDQEWLGGWEGGGAAVLLHLMFLEPWDNRWMLLMTQPCRTSTDPEGTTDQQVDCMYDPTYEDSRCVGHE